MFGFDTGAPLPRRSATSQRHMDAIKQMARESQTKNIFPQKK
jgi:hypothetical protein